MNKVSLSTEVPLEWFTVEEAAQYLRVSKRTIYKWSREGRLPAYLIGNRRHRRYRKDDLDKVPRPADPQGNIKIDLPPIIVPLLKLEFPGLGPAGQSQELEVDT